MLISRFRVEPALFVWMILISENLVQLLFEQAVQRQAEHKQHRQLAQGNQAALEQEVAEVELPRIDEEKVNFKADEDAVHQRRHQLKDCAHVRP